MNSTAIRRIDHGRSGYARWVQPAAWIWLAILGVLFSLVFRPFLERMILIASEGFTGIDPDWGHILVIPLISCFFVYTQRDRLRQTPIRTCWWGLPLLLAGLLSFSLGLFPIRNDMFQGMSMILALFGLVLFLLGTTMMRWLWFPIFYLVFMIKISDRIWETIAFKLQVLAAELATYVLTFLSNFLDFFVTNRGSTIDLSFMSGGVWTTESLNVAEACAGLRMLMAFIALGVAIAFLWCRRWWQKLIMIAMTVPIAVGVNVGRVAILGVLYLYNRELAQGAFHTFVGMLMLIPGLLLFLALGWLLDNIVIDEETADRSAGPSSSAGSLSQTDSPTSPSSDVGSLPLHWVDVVAGAASGVVLTVLFALLYFALLAGVRPDLLGQHLHDALRWSAVGLLVVVLLGALFFLPRLAGKVTGGKRSGQGFTLSLTAAVLLTAWLGQSTVLGVTKFVVIRKSVPLRQPLFEVPTRIGSWQMVVERPSLPPEMEEELGTKEYFTRVYRDMDLEESAPGAIVEIHVAYYTGTTDTVPHVPDRCMLAGGAEHQGLTFDELRIDPPNTRPDDQSDGYLLTPSEMGYPVRLPGEQIPVTVFTVGMPGQRPGDDGQSQNIIYFFMANGSALATPDEVRLHGFDPRDRYGYYCKIEVRWPKIADPVKAKERTRDLLNVMLPQILACLPDWVQVKSGQWPPSESDSTEANMDLDNPTSG